MYQLRSQLPFISTCTVRPYCAIAINRPTRPLIVLCDSRNTRMQKNLCCCVDAALRSCGDNISGFRKHEFASALREEALPPRCILTDQAQNGQGTLPHQSDVAIPQSVDRATLEPTSPPCSHGTTGLPSRLSASARPHSKCKMFTTHRRAKP